MRSDRPEDPWGSMTYKGFADTPPPAPPRAQASPRHPARRGLVLGGVGVALALGLGLGLLARPQLIGGSAAPVTSQAVATPGAAQTPMTITTAPPPPARPPAPALGRLEVLPPEMAEAARRQAPLAVRPSAPPPQPQPQSQSPVSIEPPPSAPAPRASFDCAAARPGAEQAVCDDPQLASADRRMARAYRRALEAGVDARFLRQEQRDWMAIREDAAARSPDALASVYAQRIGELDQMAEGVAPEEVR